MRLLEHSEIHRSLCSIIPDRTVNRGEIKHNLRSISYNLYAGRLVVLNTY